MQISTHAKSKLLRAAYLGSSAIALGISAPALAQVEEIVVTAQKVEENVQDVPIAITAVSGDTLAASGTNSLENLSQLVPSVTFRKGTTNANSAVVLRGVGTISFSIAAEPSVSTVVDGVVLSRSGQAFADLVEIERLEVLRGPQGTLFGKNASAGLINVVSKGGTDTLEGEFTAEYYEGNEVRTRATISGPIAQDLTFRTNAFYGKYKGNITNVVPFGTRDEKINGYEHIGFRGLLDFDNGPARIKLIADYYEADDDCCGEVTGVSRGSVLNAELNLPLGVAQGENQRFVNHNLVTQSLDRQYGITVNADFDVFTSHTFSAIYGYRNWNNEELREGDFLPRAIVGTPQLHDRGFVETDQSSLELRLASDQSKAFKYQVGTFYWKSENSQDFTRNVITCTTSTLPVDPRTGARPCNLADNVNTLFPTATSRSVVDIENYAVFGQATYDFTDRIGLTVGMRWTHDSIDYAHRRAPGVNRTTGLPATGAGISGSPAGGTITSGGNGTVLSTGSSSNSNFSGKAVLTVKPTDDIMLYGSYTRGYKGPAFNVFFNHTAPVNAVPIDEETSDSFEVGFKSQFADNRIQVNASAFQVTYDGFQANNFVLLNGAVVTNLTNAGQVRSTGFELDVLANPVEGLDLFGSVAYADAKVRRFNPNPLTNAPDARDGTKLPLAPEWSWNIGAAYETPFSFFGGDAKVYLRTSFNHVGKQFSDLGQSGPIDSYGLWNASVGYSDAEDNWRLTFIMRNITDDSYVLLNTSAGQRLHIPRDADRYMGASLRFRL
ncbi:TonB-dependent receptor [Sphingorhabdus sp.]|uniref:TonB-dependent receptor n=1 Tax=Sphingorhabdus sp. TaxID=1902408 RepID=UPI00398322A9